MRILLVDDHDLFRQGMKYLLPALDETIDFVDAASLEQALQCEQADNVHLILLDYHLPGVVGMNALQQLRNVFETASIVIVSGEEDPQVIQESISLGAAGYIPKTSSREELARALNLVLAGATYLPPNALRSFANKSDSIRSTPATIKNLSEQLTQRQLAVLTKVMQGKSNKVVARELAITDHTVKAHLSAAFQVLGVRNRTEAVYAAARLGIPLTDQDLEQTTDSKACV